MLWILLRSNQNLFYHSVKFYGGLDVTKHADNYDTPKIAERKQTHPEFFSTRSTGGSHLLPLG